MARLARNNPLTEAQRALAAEHFKLAAWAACRRPKAISILGWEDVLSAAHLGLCVAARVYNPARGRFATIAVRTIHSHINNELKAFHRAKRMPTKSDGTRAMLYSIVRDTYPAYHSPDQTYIDGIDWLASLPPGERTVIEFRLAGLSLKQIGERMGRTKQWISVLQRRAMGRL